jgi:hypothetical protein
MIFHRLVNRNETSTVKSRISTSINNFDNEGNPLYQQHCTTLNSYRKCCSLSKPELTPLSKLRSEPNRCLHHFRFQITTATMAAEVPTFKLVLVGDGGTGKVSNTLLKGLFAVIIIPNSDALISSPSLSSWSLVLDAADQGICRQRSSSAI